MTYEIMHHFAKSWGALGMMIFFLGAVAYTFRPGSRKIHDDIAQIPLRNDKLGE